MCLWALKRGFYFVLKCYLIKYIYSQSCTHIWTLPFFPSPSFFIIAGKCIPNVYTSYGEFRTHTFFHTCRFTNPFLKSVWFQAECYCEHITWDWGFHCYDQDQIPFWDSWLHFWSDSAICSHLKSVCAQSMYEHCKCTVTYLSTVDAFWFKGLSRLEQSAVP